MQRHLHEVFLLFQVMVKHTAANRKLINLKQRQGEKKETHKRNAPQVSCLWMMWPKSWATKETWSITHVLLKTLMVTINVSYSYTDAKHLIYDWVTNIKENYWISGHTIYLLGSLASLKKNPPKKDLGRHRVRFMNDIK